MVKKLAAAVFVAAIAALGIVSSCEEKQDPPLPPTCGPNEVVGEDGTCVVEEPEEPGCDFQHLRDTCEHGVLRRTCECAPPPVEEPPASGVKPSDYVPTADIEGLLFWQSHNWEGLFAYDQYLAWAGTRDLLVVVSECPNFGAELLGGTNAEFTELAAVGDEILAENRRIIKQVWLRNAPNKPRDLSGTPIQNRRCVDRPEFCSVTNLSKNTREAHETKLLRHVKRTSTFRDNAQACRHDSMDPYDAIAAWCREMLEGGFTGCP